MRVPHTMLQTPKIADIKVGHRHNKDMGDLMSLASSIRQDGFPQPIGITERLELVFGESLRAHRDILKKKTIIARIVDVRASSPVNTPKARSRPISSGIATE